MASARARKGRDPLWFLDLGLGLVPRGRQRIVRHARGVLHRMLRLGAELLPRVADLSRRLADVAAHFVDPGDLARRLLRLVPRLLKRVVRRATGVLCGFLHVSTGLFQNVVGVVSRSLDGRLRVSGRGKHRAQAHDRQSHIRNSHRPASHLLPLLSIASRVGRRARRARLRLHSVQ